MSRPAPVPPPLPADPQPVLLDGGSRAWALAAAGLALLPLLLTLPPQLGAGFGVLAPVVALLAWRRPLPGWLRGSVEVFGLRLGIVPTNFHQQFVLGFAASFCFAVRQVFAKRDHRIFRKIIREKE